MKAFRKYKIIAYLDTVEDRVIPQSLEIVAFIKQVGIKDSSDALLVVTGKNIMDECRTLSGIYGIDTKAIEHGEFYYPNPALLVKILHGIIEEHDPDTVCFTHTIRNCSTAAALSAAMKIPCITAVESLSRDSEGISFQRSFFNGKLKQKVKTSASRRIVTVIQGAFKVKGEEVQDRRSADVLQIKIDEGTTGYRPLSINKAAETESGLEDADVIISAGRGIGKPENLELVRGAARLFNNSAIGASRTVCDNKWLPYRHQVGVTGRTVSPKLYMALGISGSQQHIAGMKNSQCIVAVNIDPHAAIFSVADYIIVEDITRFIPALISRYHEKSRGNS